MTTAVDVDVLNQIGDLQIPCGIDELAEIPQCQEPAVYAVHVHECHLTFCCHKHWEALLDLFRRMKAGTHKSFKCVKCHKTALTVEELIWVTPL